MSVELKVKAKTLAAEAQIIRKEERKYVNWGAQPYSQMDRAREGLYLHRTGTVRRAARLTHLARAFIACTPYKAVEATVRPDNQLGDWHMREIAKMVSKYGKHGDVTHASIRAWTEGMILKPAAEAAE